MYVQISGTILQDLCHRRMQMTILLVPKSRYGLVEPEWAIIDLVNETPEAWFGRPLSNDHCPMLEYPKSAWRLVPCETAP